MQTLENTNALLDDDYRIRKYSVRKCYLAAKEAKFKYFAVQDGQCFAGNGEDYKMYGRSTNCLDGRGGLQTIDVYEIEQGNSYLLL